MAIPSGRKNTASLVLSSPLNFRKDFIPHQNTNKVTKIYEIPTNKYILDYMIHSNDCSKSIIENKSIEDIVYDFANGLRSAMSYLGFRSLENMRGGLWTNKIIAVRTTVNSMYEGFAHGK